MAEPTPAVRQRLDNLARGAALNRSGPFFLEIEGQRYLVEPGRWRRASVGERIAKRMSDIKGLLTR